MVTAVSGNTLTLEDPLVWSYNLNPRLKALVVRGMRWSGIEDLTVSGDASYTGYMISYWSSYASWVKNVELTGGKSNAMLSLYRSLRTEIRDSYLHDTLSTTDGYGILTFLDRVATAPEPRGLQSRIIFLKVCGTP